MAEMISPGESVYRHNRLAKNLSIAWFVIALALMLWSFLSVAIVPRKGTTPAVKAYGLADDRQAYSRGLLHYISLGWVDELVGRYGKLTHGVIDDNEIICNRRDGSWKPLETPLFIFLWFNVAQFLDDCGCVMLCELWHVS